MKIFKCKLCSYLTNRSYNYKKHCKTKKHIENIKNKSEYNIFNCFCGKQYKSRSGLWRHKKTCNYNEITNIKNEIIKLKNNDTLLTTELINSNNHACQFIKNNNELINEVKKLKETKNQIVTQNIQNNTQNISINVFLNERCKNAMNLTDFIEKLQVTFDDLVYTGKTNYVEGISRILIKNLNKLNKVDRPIHCSDVKRKILYIKNEEGWEKDKKHEKITKCIKYVEFKQIQKIPEWTKEEKIDIYKNNAQGMKYQKIIFNSMGGMDQEKREKNKKNVIKNLSETTDFKI